MRYAIGSIAFCSVLAAAVADVAPADARHVALVIGNSAYEYTRVLPNARNDARIIAALLGTIGFAVTEANDLAYRPMREAIRAFGQRAQGAEMALVYYAGHGLEVAGENWLLPVSAALRHERDLEYEAVSLSSILAAVKEAGRLRLVILDACRNNPLGDRIALSSTTTRSVSRGLARVEPSGDILVAYSAKHGTLAEDGPAGGNSPFAAALVMNLGAPGLDVRIMLGKVRDDVRKATGGRQEPFTYGSVGGETIALRPGDTSAIAPALPGPVAPPSKTKVAIGTNSEVKPAVVPRISEATVRARLAGLEVKTSSDRVGWLTIGTWREPQVQLSESGFQIDMLYNGLDDAKWPATRIAEVLAAEICGQVDSGVMERFLKSVYQSKSLVPEVDMGGNGGFSFKKRLVRSLGACRVEMLAEGARWHNLTITVRR